MSLSLAQFAQPFTFSWPDQLLMVNYIGRLLLACVLGALVGIERQVDTKSFGIRTNLLICLGSSVFTILSAVLAGDGSPNRGQVASNIVQGIGFLGAGLILHNRSRVSGLASAATVWVVASIGMACGAGLYLAAAVAAFIVMAAMRLVGVLEHSANLKRFSVIYEARGVDPVRMLEEILEAMDRAGERLADVETSSIGEIQRITFPLSATHSHHERVRASLQAQPAIGSLFIFPDPEDN